MNAVRKKKVTSLDLQASLLLFLQTALCQFDSQIFIWRVSHKQQINFITIWFAVNILKSFIFCWAGHSSGFLSQARLAECYLGAHQWCLAVETWWTCIHWPIKHITCWPAWQPNPCFFEESAQVLIETTSSATRCTWGTISYFQFKYMYVATQEAFNNVLLYLQVLINSILKSKIHKEAKQKGLDIHFSK